MNLKLKLFEYRKDLTIDQIEEARLATKYLQIYDDLSEKEYASYITEEMTPYAFSDGTKKLLEEIKVEIESQPLLYSLKDLYKRIERKNLGELYRPALNTLLNTINKDDDNARLESVLNELSIHDWIPEVKSFLIGIHNNPFEVQNLNGNGKGLKVYSVTEKVEEGTLCFVSDRWFLISEKEIKQVLFDEYVSDEAKIRQARILEQVMTLSEITDEKISLAVDENLAIGISTKDGNIYLNEEKADKETTLESLFNSPLIPYLKRDYYLLFETLRTNIDKIVELDVAMKVVNPVKTYLENYVFNYKDKIYLYSKDARRGSSFFEYENASEIIRDVQKELDYDVTKFFENKLSKELKALRSLEDKEKQITIKLSDVNESIELLTEQKELLNESKELSDTLNNLLIYKNDLLKSLGAIKNEKTKAKKILLVK